MGKERPGANASAGIAAILTLHHETARPHVPALYPMQSWSGLVITLGQVDFFPCPVSSPSHLGYSICCCHQSHPGSIVPHPTLLPPRNTPSPFRLPFHHPVPSPCTAWCNSYLCQLARRLQSALADRLMSLRQHCWLSSGCKRALQHIRHTQS